VRCRGTPTQGGPVSIVSRVCRAIVSAASSAIYACLLHSRRDQRVESRPWARGCVAEGRRRPFSGRRQKLPKKSEEQAWSISPARIAVASGRGDRSLSHQGRQGPNEERTSTFKTISVKNGDT
jgi:hypothetical protein